MLKQEYTSKDTSVNTVAAVYKVLPKEVSEAYILDYGGGKYNSNVEYAKDVLNSIVLVYDPYNRSKEHNFEVISFFKAHPAKYVVCSNVLNVIKEEEVILDALQKMYKLTAKNGFIYIKVYVRDGNGIGVKTSKGWQRNDKSDEYLKFIWKALGNNIEIVRKTRELIVVKKLK